MFFDSCEHLDSETPQSEVTVCSEVQELPFNKPATGKAFIHYIDFISVQMKEKNSQVKVKLYHNKYSKAAGCHFNYKYINI